MDEGRFWSLIDLIGGYPPEDEVESFKRVEHALALLEDYEILGFEDLLAEMLYKIDRREFAELLTEDTGREQSTDSFLYNRCAVVVAGRVAYEEVSDRSRPFSSFTSSHVASSEPLLYLAEGAYGRKGDRKWDHVSPLNYETGSNSAAWE